MALVPECGFFIKGIGGRVALTINKFSYENDEIRDLTVLLPELPQADGCRIEIRVVNVTFRLATRRKMWKTERYCKFNLVPSSKSCLATIRLD